ncbi:MAG TPA: lipid-A-disaccharide synthase [Thermoanaerobaculia bacterium]
MNLLISAGEASGDLHGARLLEALCRRRPSLTAFGMGGGRLASAGLERLARAEDLSVMGFAEVLERLPAVLRALSALRAAAARRRPEAAVLIDFPDFHAALSRRLRQEGIPLIYYVSPQVWAWRPGRARVIAERARRILTLFPFETAIYAKYGADAVCTGHPVVDDVREALAAEPEPPAKTGRRLVLLPGSRRSEVRRHWPPMRDAAAILRSRRGVETFAALAPGLSPDLYPGAQEAGVRLAGPGVHRLIASADVAFVASGTATLEVALCGTPLVVVYRTSRSSFAIGSALVRVPWISLVNIVAQESVVPEILQDRLTPEALTAEAESLLDSDERRHTMKRGLERVARELGPPGASDRAAEAVLEVVEGGTRAPALAAGR